MVLWHGGECVRVVSIIKNRAAQPHELGAHTWQGAAKGGFLEGAAPEVYLKTVENRIGGCFCQ